MTPRRPVGHGHHRKPGAAGRDRRARPRAGGRPGLRPGQGRTRRGRAGRSPDDRGHHNRRAGRDSRARTRTSSSTWAGSSTTRRAASPTSSTCSAPASTSSPPAARSSTPRRSTRLDTRRSSRPASAVASTFLGVGLFPGFWGEAIAPVLSRLAFNCDRIAVRETLSYAGYPSTQLLFDIMGYGHPADSDVPMMSDPARAGGAFNGTATVLAKALGLDVAALEPYREVAVTDRELTVAAGTIPAGTVGAMKLGVRADCGPVTIEVEHVTWMAPDVQPMWSAGGEGYHIEFDGGTVACGAASSSASTARTTPTWGAWPPRCTPCTRSRPCRAAARRARPRRRDHLRRETDMSDVTPARIGVLDRLRRSQGRLRREHPPLARSSSPTSSREQGLLERPVEFVVRAVQGLPERHVPRGARRVPRARRRGRARDLRALGLGERRGARAATSRRSPRSSCITMGGIRVACSASGSSACPPARWKRSRSSWRPIAALDGCRIGGHRVRGLAHRQRVPPHHPGRVQRRRAPDHRRGADPAGRGGEAGGDGRSSPTASPTASSTSASASAFPG